MCELINEYINLEYDKSNKEQVLTEIFTLSKRIKFKDDDEFSIRFLKTASVIKQNLSLFNSACEHVDTITTILEYLTNFGVKFLFDNRDEEYNKYEVILSVMLTIFNICKELKVQLFLENTIIKSSILCNCNQYNCLKNELLNQTNEMILLEDSDLYTVISYLRIIERSHINKIWVQISIKQKFLSLIRKYFCLKEFIIYTFKSTKEFTVPRTSYNMNIISIWSEDIVYARYLATVLNRDVIFVNMHMDLYGGVMLLPYIKIFDKINERFQPTFNDSIKPYKNEINLSHFPQENKKCTFISNLFYDGKWQKPMKNTYVTYDNVLYANATSDDVKMCFNSAVEGFKIWKTFSLENRIHFLSQVLTENLLDKVAPISKLFLKINQTWLLCSQNDRLEVIQYRIPRGVIILKEETNNVTTLIRLIQILVSGNAVIVIAHAKSDFATYCDIFSTLDIPRGIVNFLSNENISDLELSLCATDYVNYEKQLFTPNLEKTYINLTLPKQIVLSLK